MRNFSAPARYGPWLEGKISELVEQIRRDIHRRDLGHTPEIPDFMIHQTRIGDTMVLVGTPDPAAKRRSA